MQGPNVHRRRVDLRRFHVLDEFESNELADKSTTYTTGDVETRTSKSLHFSAGM